MATLKKVYGTDITYLFNGSYQQLYATMIRFPLGEQMAKLFAEVDANSNNDVIIWNKPYDGNINYYSVEDSPEKNVLLMLWSKREKEIRARLTQAKVSDVDKLLTFPDFSYLFYTINEQADDDVPEKKYNLILTGWGCQSGIQINKGSNDAIQQKKEAESKHQEVIVHFVDEQEKPIINRTFTYTYNNGNDYSINSKNGTIDLGLCLINSAFAFKDTTTSLENSFHVTKGQSEYTLSFAPPKKDTHEERKEEIVPPVIDNPPVNPAPPKTRVLKVVTESLIPIPFYALSIQFGEEKQEKISQSEGLITLPTELNEQSEFEVCDPKSEKIERFLVDDTLEYVFVVPDQKPLQDAKVRVVNQKGNPVSEIPITIQTGDKLIDVITDEYGVYPLGKLRVDDTFMVACTEAKHINQKFVVEKDKDEYIFQIEEALSPVTVVLMDKKKVIIPSASMTLTNIKGETYEHYTDEEGKIRVPQSFFTEQEEVKVHVELPNTNVSDCKFKYEEKYDLYNIIIKDPFPWKKLLHLLALLLLFGLLFVRCNKDITIKVVETDKRPVNGAQVEMSYTEYQLFKNGTFFYSMSHTENDITDASGCVKFEKQPCSVFSWIFCTLSKAHATAEKDGYSGAGSFLFHWRFTPYIIVLGRDITMQVVDALTEAPISNAYLQLTSGDLNFKPLELSTDQNGLCGFKTNLQNATIEKILVTASGYSGFLAYDLSLQQIDGCIIPLDRPASCNVEVNNNNGNQGNHAIRDFNMGKKAGQFLFEYYTDSARDHIMVYDGTSSDYAVGNAKLIFDYDGATCTTTFSHSAIISFSTSSICVVVDNGTNWGYYVHCPN